MSKQHRQVKGVRCDSVLPKLIEDFGRIATLIDWYDWLLNKRPAKKNSEETDLLRVYASLIIENGFPHAVSIDVILRLRDLRPADCRTVDIPIHKTDHTKRRTQLTLSKPSVEVIRGWKKRHRISQLELDIRPNRLYKKLESTLKKEFRRLLPTWPADAPLLFRDIGKLGTTVAIQNGVEPYVVTALAGRVRPTSQAPDDTYLVNDVSHESLSHIVTTYTPASMESDTASFRSSEPQVDQTSPPPDWIGKSRKLLRNLCSDLATAHPRKLSTAKLQEKARKIIRRYAEQARCLAPKDSVLVLAIEYAEFCYIDNPTISARSLRDYLDRAVINGLLDSEASYSLGDWDPDDFVENVENRLDEPDLKDSTRCKILEAYAPLLNFLTRRLNLPHVPIGPLRQNYVSGAGQWSLISPHAIDEAILSLYAHPSLAYRQAAVITALAFYGGLRASEARRLTMANIVFNDRLENLDIELLRGKSANARRRLPLASLAPTPIIEMIRDYWGARREEFKESLPLSKIAVFGARKDPAPYLYQSISRLTRKILKQIFGKEITLHMLRHCFCSFLFLRWYATRNSDVLTNITFRSHALFQPALQVKLSDYFECTKYEDGDIRPFDLVSMIKLSGHASPETLFQYYIHTFSVVQAHGIQRTRSALDDPLLEPERRSCRLSRPSTTTEKLSGHSTARPLEHYPDHIK